MPTFAVHVGALAKCPHGGSVTFVPGGIPRVFVSGQPVATMTDMDIVAGCAFNLSGAPHPCLQIRWLAPALRVTSSLAPLILLTRGGACLAADQAPQGPPIIGSTQVRVLGT